MKIALVYTSTTPELVEMVNREAIEMFGKDIMIMSYENPTILTQIREHGCVTPETAAKLISMFMQAVLDGADAILNICSSVGDIVDCMQEAAKYIGVPIVRIDERMCKAAVNKGRRIGLMATLQTTLMPTRRAVLRVAKEQQVDVVVKDILVQGAFGLDEKKLSQLLFDYAEEVKDEIDILLLCQGSMACSEKFLSEKLGIPVVSSPHYGFEDLKEALVRKQIIK